MMALQASKAADYRPADLAALFSRSFANYLVGSVNLDAYSFAGLMARENVDLTLSLVAVRDSKPVGFGLIARQGWSSRLAAMGMVPEAAGQGVGRWLLQQLIEQARARGDRLMELEAFEQNTPAVRLYEGAGFEMVRRLYGYEVDTAHGLLGDTLLPVDIAEIGRAVAYYGDRDLPWQISGTTICRFSPPHLGFQMEHAYAVISAPSSPTVVIRALFVLPDFRRQGEAARLLSHLFAIYPDKRWVVPQICPEEYGYVYERFGFKRSPMNQFQMRLFLS
jgi:GNAT superfamily N-acetyltransferase